MALRKLGSLIRVSTKGGLAGGTLYLYYEAGLWRGTDETIQNYEKLQKETRVLIDSNPDVKKWTEYIASSVKSNVKPYTEAVANFKKQWLDYDFSSLGSPINGVVKPTWNKGVEWTCEAVANSPETIQKLGTSGMQKLKELTLENPTSSQTKSTEGSAAAMKAKQ